MGLVWFLFGFVVWFVFGFVVQLVGVVCLFCCFVGVDFWLLVLCFVGFVGGLVVSMT